VKRPATGPLCLVCKRTAARPVKLPSGATCLLCPTCEIDRYMLLEAERRVHECR
jgi:hypothetical protein